MLVIMTDKDLYRLGIIQDFVDLHCLCLLQRYRIEGLLGMASRMRQPGGYL